MASTMRAAATTAAVARIAVYSCFNNFTGVVQSAGGSGAAQPGSVLIDTIAGNVAAVAKAFCTGDDATLAVQAGGVSTITYQCAQRRERFEWNAKPSAVYAGATGPTLTITDVTQFEQGFLRRCGYSERASIVSNAVSVDVVGIAIPV